jgi:DNA-binding beta-propeller fold protein YncE
MLSLPHDVAFGPDGQLYVSNSGSGLVQRFRADTGEFAGTFIQDAALHNPLGLAWGPDGHLYVANQGGNEVRRYDGATGAFAGAFVAPGAGGLSAPSFMAFVPAPLLAVTVVQRGSDGEITLAVSGARPGARVLLVLGSPLGSSEAAECPSVRLGVGEPRTLAGLVADEGGNAVLRLRPAAGADVSAVALDTARCTATAPVPLTSPMP